MIRITLDSWQKFLDSLASDGGHIVVLFVLLLIGWRMFQADATAGGSIMTLSSGAILALMKGSEKKANGDSTVTSVTPPEIGKEQKV